MVYFTNFDKVNTKLQEEKSIMLKIEITRGINPLRLKKMKIQGR